MLNLESTKLKVLKIIKVFYSITVILFFQLIMPYLIEMVENSYLFFKIDPGNQNFKNGIMNLDDFLKKKKY